jgi:hypothetical protein
MGAAAKYFFSTSVDADTLNKRVRPSDAQRDFLKSNKDALKLHLESDLRRRCGYSVSTWLQGSYKLHTLVRPIYGGDYDVDVGVYVAWGSGEIPLAPRDLRDHTQDSLQEFARQSETTCEVIDPPKQRCSRVKYDKHFHIDTPIYHHNSDTGVARLATMDDEWELSDPEKMVEWFQGRLDGAERAQARRLVRYLKAWAALRFRSDQEARPSSLLLTVLSVDAYAENVEGRDLEDDDALQEVVTSMVDRLALSTAVANPVGSDADGDLNRLSSEGEERFLQALDELLEVCERATSNVDEGAAVAAWTDAFDFLFPLPDTEGLVEADAQQSAMVATPTIAIDVYEADGRRARSYEGEVDFARIGQTLKFRITNPRILSAGSTIRWVVRNTGDHAYSENDLGHSWMDQGELERTEHVAYSGLHFMDCEIRVGGRIRSISRIPVTVTSMPSPVRRPSRPAYTLINRRR